MTLNGVMTVILRYCTEFGRFGANYVKVIEARPILSATKSKDLVLSERELKFMFAICRRPSVCRLSVVSNVRAPYSDD